MTRRALILAAFQGPSKAYKREQFIAAYNECVLAAVDFAKKFNATHQDQIDMGAVSAFDKFSDLSRKAASKWREWLRA